MRSKGKHSHSNTHTDMKLDSEAESVCEGANGPLSSFKGIVQAQKNTWESVHSLSAKN